MTPFTDQLKAARRASVPLVVIRTADPAQTIRNVRAALNGSEPPLVQWDIVRAFRAVNDAGKESLSHVQDADQITDPRTALMACAALPPETVVFVMNFHRVIAEQGVSQAVWNLRDPFKGESHRMLVMLCPSMDLPVEIQQDVLVLDEPLPTNDELGAIIKDVYRSAQLTPPKSEVIGSATDALCGLAAFPAEQAAAMSMAKAGIQIDPLWNRKRQAIEQTRGLSVVADEETYSDVRGCANVIEFFTGMFNGEQPPLACVWQDEVEKQYAGMGSDTSGVATEMGGGFLTWMQERKALGVLLLGHPGCAKSLIAKTTGRTFGRPTIAYEATTMKSSLVGESTMYQRQALRVIEAISQGRVLVIATCNSFGDLPPEFRRRFKDATFFFDLPTQEERMAIWKLYLKKYNIAGERAKLPPDNGWTGAEIAQCAAHAWRFRTTLIKASAYIVPTAKSGADRVQRLRQMADGKFISASYSGPYKMIGDEAPQTQRKLEVV